MMIYYVGTRISLNQLNFAYFGSAFDLIPSLESVDVVSMNYAYFGSPFVTYSRGNNP